MPRCLPGERVQNARRGRPSPAGAQLCKMALHSDPAPACSSRGATDTQPNSTRANFPSNLILAQFMFGSLDTKDARAWSP